MRRGRKEKEKSAGLQGCAQRAKLGLERYDSNITTRTYAHAHAAFARIHTNVRIPHTSGRAKEIAENSGGKKRPKG